MKKYLILLLMLSLSVSIYAQDVIVKKDRTTILAKVLSVGIDVVEYKNWNNQDGPTYVVEKTEILSINYANGNKDDFSNVTAVPQTEYSTSTSPSVSQEDFVTAIKAANKSAYRATAGRGKIIGGSLLIALVGVPAAVSGGALIAFSDATVAGTTGIVVGVVGTMGGALLISSGREDRKDAYAMQQIPLIQHQFKIGDYALIPSVDVYTNHITKQKGLGAGLCFNF